MSTCAQPQGCPTQQISISLSLTGESSGLPHCLNSLHRGKRYTHHMGTFTPHRGTHRFISNDTPISWASSPHRGTHIDTPISWESSPHIGAHIVPSQSQRGTTHPSHGLSHRPTHSVCVLEDVSRSCNHQHSLSARETFSSRPSLSQKYSNFVLESEDICNLLMCRKVLHMYFFPLHHVSDIMIFYLNVF
jgi:hypothetical protein